MKNLNKYPRDVKVFPTCEYFREILRCYLKIYYRLLAEESLASTRELYLSRECFLPTYLSILIYPKRKKNQRI